MRKADRLLLVTSIRCMNVKFNL